MVASQDRASICQRPRRGSLSLRTRRVNLGRMDNTLADLNRSLDDLESRLPAMLAMHSDHGEFWCAFAGARGRTATAPSEARRPGRRASSRQEPGAGASLRRDHPVAVVVSAGPAFVTVPDVTGQSTGRARQLLEDAGFTVEETEILGDLLGDREGTVRRQSPEPGSQARPGSTVRIIIL